MNNLLTNSNFNDTRRVLVPDASGTVPFGWTGWYKNLPGRRKIPWDLSNDTGYVAPEYKPITAAAPYLDPPRHIGGYGQCWFGQGRHLWSGMWQKVSVPIGATLHFTVKAHGWSNGLPDPKTINNPFWSEGVGAGAYFQIANPDWPNVPLNGDPIHDAEPNMNFDIGIDPLGGDDPFSLNIKWGAGAHIYNVFAPVPEVWATSVNNIITVFMRARTLWGFSHNDTYWAEASLLAETPEEPPVDYVVIVNLLPQDATRAEKAQVLDQVHASKQTILQSADDALRLVEPGRPGSEVVIWGATRWPGGARAMQLYLSPCVVRFVEF